MMTISVVRAQVAESVVLAFVEDATSVPRKRQVADADVLFATLEDTLPMATFLLLRNRFADWKL